MLNVVPCSKMLMTISALAVVPTMWSAEGSAQQRETLGATLTPVEGTERWETAPRRAYLGPDHRWWIGFPQEGILRAVGPLPGSLNLEEYSVPGEDWGDGQASVVLGWTGDTLWIVNRQTSLAAAVTPRIVGLGPDGAVRIATAISPPDEPDGLRIGSLVGIAPGQRLIWGAWPLALTVSPPPPSRTASTNETASLGIDGGDPVPAHFIEADFDGSSPRLILEHEQGPLQYGIASRLDGGGGTRVRIRPILDDELVAVRPGQSAGVIVSRRVRDTGYGIRAMDSSGAALFTRAHADERVALPDTTARRLMEGVLDGTEHEDGPQTRRLAGIPPHYPSVSAVLADLHGWVWLRREAQAGASETRWTVLDPEGTEVGDFHLPMGLSVLGFQGLQGWGYRTDAARDPRLADGARLVRIDLAPR